MGDFDKARHGETVIIPYSTLMINLEMVGFFSLDDFENWLACFGLQYTYLPPSGNCTEGFYKIYKP